MEEYLDFLTAVADGKITRSQWLKWWDDNAKGIESKLNRSQYLLLKLQPYHQARAILSHQEIKNCRDKTQCSYCGVTLFQAIPHQTTREQIKEFARYCDLPNAKQIEEEGWIHPGTYCPNGCIVALATYKPE